MKVREKFIFISITIIILVLLISNYWSPVLWSFVVFIPLIIMGVIDLIQKKHAIRRNFPVLGRIRSILEAIRPEIMQYFVETDTQGRPK